MRCRGTVNGKYNRRIVGIAEEASDEVGGSPGRKNRETQHTNARA